MIASDTAEVGLDKILDRVNRCQMSGTDLTFTSSELFDLEHILELATIGLYRDVNSSCNCKKLL